METRFLLIDENAENHEFATKTELREAIIEAMEYESLENLQAFEIVKEFELEQSVKLI